jgi:hypothetical protein
MGHIRSVAEENLDNRNRSIRAETKGKEVAMDMKVKNGISWAG